MMQPPPASIPSKLAWTAALALTALTLPEVSAQIQPAAKTLAESVAAKLGSAKTIRLSARHHADPALGVGSKLEQGKIQITLRRPNQFYIIQPAGEETREIAYDGRIFCMMQPGLGNHGLAPVKAASIEKFGDLAALQFGFRPPVGELLANNLAAHLFENVTSAQVIARERIGWTVCDHLRLGQNGMITDIWVGAKDKLPRRLKFTYTDQRGNPAWDIRLSKWELNGPVDTRLFSKRPAADSIPVEMHRSR